jgi:NADH-quinone oxidoreductase subunit C
MRQPVPSMENQYLQQLTTQLQDKVKRAHIYVGEISITVNAEECFAVLKSLKEEFGFSMLADIVAIDHYTDEKRFEIAYNLFNLDQNRRLRVKTYVEEANPELDSAVPIWPAANWYEREAWDMMGIRFRNHPDLRRIYMPEDFQYFPLRKEFPLIGIPGSIQMPIKDE